MDDIEQRKIVGQITIDIYSDMSVSVKGFPINHQVALGVMSNALIAVADWFIKEEGHKVNNAIIQATPNIKVVPSIDLSKIQRR
mgnify:CR=1 FL=1